MAYNIRIGSGDFNDIVVNDKDALLEHCEIIFDKDKMHVYRISREAIVFINGEKMENRYADIKTGDQLRIGDTIINWEDYFNVIKDRLTEEAIENTIAKEIIKKEKRIAKKALLILIIHYSIFFGLGYFVIWSLLDGTKIWIIISAILFSAYCLISIVSNIISRKKESEEDKEMQKHFKFHRIFLLIILIPFITRTCDNQAKRHRQFEISKQRTKQYIESTDFNNYYRVVYNDSDHDVTISYQPTGMKDTILSFYIAKGSFDTIAIVSDFDYSKPFQKNSILNFTKDGITMIFDDNTSITHQFKQNRVEPEENNILSIPSWAKDTTHGYVALYTITPETYSHAHNSTMQ